MQAGVSNAPSCRSANTPWRRSNIRDAFHGNLSAPFTQLSILPSSETAGHEVLCSRDDASLSMSMPRTRDAISIGAALILTALVAGAASYFPARRASPIDPVITPRTE